MSWPHHFHSEFGFLCPTARMRREIRIAFVSTVFGGIVGAVGAFMLFAGHQDGDTAAIASLGQANTAISAPPPSGTATSTTARNYREALVNSPDSIPEAAAAHDIETEATATGSENGMQDRPTSSVAPPKKPLKATRGQNRQSNEPSNHYSSHEERADPWAKRADTNNRGGRLGRIYAGDGSYSRHGFWDWSR
jgi:hypothetical protein